MQTNIFIDSFFPFNQVNKMVSYLGSFVGEIFVNRHFCWSSQYFRSAVLSVSGLKRSEKKISWNQKLFETETSTVTLAATTQFVFYS